MEEYSQKSLDELLRIVTDSETELRSAYRFIYKNPNYYRPDTIFGNLDEKIKYSIIASTGAFWNAKRKVTNNISIIDCFACAQEWLKSRGFKYADSDISLHDLSMRFQQLKNKDIKKKHRG
jgi:hypothetical protein